MAKLRHSLRPLPTIPAPNQVLFSSSRPGSVAVLINATPEAFGHFS